MRRRDGSWKVGQWSTAGRSHSSLTPLSGCACVETPVLLFCFVPAASSIDVTPPHLPERWRFIFLGAVMQNHSGWARVLHSQFLPYFHLFEALAGNHKFKSDLCFLNVPVRNNAGGGGCMFWVFFFQVPSVNFLFLSFRMISFPIPLSFLIQCHIMSACTLLFLGGAAATHPSGAEQRQHRPHDPRAYITAAIPKLEHGAWKEGGAQGTTYKNTAPTSFPD